MAQPHNDEGDFDADFHEEVPECSGFSFSSGNDTCLNEAGTSDQSMGMFICKTPTCQYVNMFVSEVILSGITLPLHVDQLVTIMVALADSTMMMQLCYNNGEVKTLQLCTELLGTPTIPYLAEQHTVKS